MQQLRIDAAAVIAHQDAQVVERVFHLKLDAFRPGMTECVDQCFPPDAVDFVAQDAGAAAWAARPQSHESRRRPGVRVPVGYEQMPVPDGGNRYGAMRRPRTALRPSSITWLNQLKHAAQPRLLRRILGQAVDGDVQLHGGAEEALQQCIVQFLRDAGALAEPLFKAQVELPCKLAQPQAIEGQNRKGAGRDNASRNHQVCQNAGAISKSSVASCPFHRPSELLAVKWKR